MLVRDVRDGGNIEFDVIESMLRQSMGRRFEDGPLDLGIDHVTKQALDFERFRGCLAGLVLHDLVRDFDGYRANDAGCHASFTQNGISQVTRRGLAISPSDADHSEFSRGMVKEFSGDWGKRDARVDYADGRNIVVDFPIDENGG